MKKGIEIVLGLFIVLLAVAGCKDDNKASSGKPQEIVDVAYWTDLNPSDRADARNAAMGTILEIFNNEFSQKTGVRLVYESQAWDSSRILQAAAAGTGPDIAHVFTENVRQNIVAGVLQPITDFAKRFIAANPDYMFTPEQLIVDGEIYYLPFETRTVELIYRSDIYGDKFANARNAYELIDITRPYTKDNISGFLIALSGAGNGAGLFEFVNPFLIGIGGSFVDKDGNWTINTEEQVKAAQFVKMWFDRGVANRTSLTTGPDEMLQGMQAGTALAACSIGTHRFAFARNSQYKDVVTAVPFPGLEDGTKAASYTTGKGLFIGKYAKNIEACEKAIEVLLSPELQKFWFGTGLIPTRSKVYDFDDVKANSDYELLKSFGDYAGSGVITYFPDNITEVKLTYSQEMQKVVFENADIKATLDAMQARFGK
jgi:ABC-type glycerol-3-phosphate transport system substrate-binding protein